MRYINMGFTGMFSVETVLKIIGFGIKVGILEQTQQKNKKNSLNYNSPFATIRSSCVSLSRRKRYLLRIRDQFFHSPNLSLLIDQTSQTCT